MIGRTIFVFDLNHRVYDKNPVTGRAEGGPIWREHWVKREITAESPRKWLVGPRGCWGKVPKNGQLPAGFAWDEHEIDQRAWGWKNVHAIVGLVRNSHPDMLDQVAKLVGYKPRMP